eukprot:gene21281-12962_t
MVVKDVYHPDTGIVRHESPAICSHPLYAPAAASTGPPVAADPSCDSPPCTCDSLPCNNWVDNAGMMTGMSSVYSVPETPPNGTGSGQTLFYFIGAENTDGTPRGGQPPPSGRAILQPVLTFDPSAWCKGSKTGWCYSSWYESWFNLTSDDTFEVVGKNSNTGKSTSLKCPRQGRKFNWADVTLEIYAIDSCTEFAKGPMLFDNVKLWDVNMSPIKPKWLLTSPNKPCKGKITLNTNGSLAVEHSTTA